MTAGPRVVFVGRRFRHHADRSGYAELARHVDPSAVHLRGPRWIPSPLAALFARRSGVKSYGAAGIRAEASAILAMLLRGGRLYHFLYGESHYRYAGRFAALRGNRILCTFHQPPAVLEMVLRTKEHLKRLAGVVVVARNQAAYFSDLVGPDKVFVVPHAVDTSFFRPPEQRPATRTCLCVGHWLRDFAVLRETVAILRRRDKSVRVEVVTAGRKAHEIEGIEGVRVASGIPTGDLLALYRSAAVLLLPLRDATANNALLEAMACGLPAVVTDVGGTRDYVDERCARLVPPGDAARMAEEALSLLDDPARRDALGRAARERALEFDWRLVARKMAEVHATVAS